MMEAPATRDDLAAALRAAHQGHARIGALDLGRLNRVLRHAPEDLTVTVEGGLALADLQRALAQHGQWLPIDPPAPEKLTIADLIDSDVSGPRRFGYGTIREHLIGIRVALADGRIIHSGGEVVKNVAGYDLMKLFVGARRSLGVVVEAAFKLLPLPEVEQWVGVGAETWKQAATLLETIAASPLVPTAFDLHNLRNHSPHVASLTLGFAGMRPAVDWQLARVAEMGFSSIAPPDYDSQFHILPGAPIRQASVLPSKLIETIRALGDGIPFVARAGNGLLRYRGEAVIPPVSLPTAILQRIKETYDPHHIFPEAPTAW